MSRPFVPGSPRAEAEVRETIRASASGIPNNNRELLPAIDVFLDTHEQYVAPPIEHFLDPLPPVVSFAPDAEGALIEKHAGAGEYSLPAATNGTATESEWVEEDWQQYDWRAAAALADGSNAEASIDWESTDWDLGAPAQQGAKPTAAQTIARALDQIARRIRQGELTVPPPDALTDPAAIAATLAALLGVRR